MPKVFNPWSARRQNRKTPCFNDIIWRAFGAAGIPAVKEPTEVDRQDAKRPDGLTLIAWHGGRSLVWDVTVVSCFLR